MKSKRGKLIVVGIVVAVAALGVVCFDRILDIVLGRGYTEKAYYQTYSIEKINGKYETLTLYVNQPGDPRSGLFAQLNEGKVIPLDDLTPDALQQAGLQMMSSDPANGEWADGDGTRVRFENGVPTSFTIMFNSGVGVGSSPFGPFATEPVDRAMLVEIFGKPESYGTVRIGWH